MTKKQQIKLVWNDKEKDWNFHYPDRAGNSLTGLFFEMLKIEENISFLKVHGEKPETLKEMLTNRGYDFKTLKITCDKLPEGINKEEK